MKPILSVIFRAIYVAVCILLTHLSYDDCANMFSLSYYHYPIGSMSHLPLFRIRYEAMVCVVCLSIFLFLCIVLEYVHVRIKISLVSVIALHMKHLFTSLSQNYISSIFCGVRISWVINAALLHNRSWISSWKIKSLRLHGVCLENASVTNTKSHYVLQYQLWRHH